MYYNYVLLSEKDKNLYIGCTKNLERRLKEHRLGKVLSTRFRKPLKLIYYEACLNKVDAFRREKYLKSGLGKKFLNYRLKYYFNI